MSAIDLALRPVRDEVSLVATVEQVDRWMATAEAGDVLHYATRPFLPVGATGPQRLRALQDAGLVILVQKRSDLLIGHFCYLAKRTSASVDRLPAKRDNRTRAKLAAIHQDTGDADAGGVLLPIVARAAQFGRPCPTDKQLATRAGIAPERVQPGLRSLVATHHIVIHAAPAPTLRRVTIVRTGAQTGWAA